MEFKEGDRVIVRPYYGWEFSGVIVGKNYDTFGYSDEGFYYQIEHKGYGVSLVNPVKVIGLDKEWYREQKLNSILENLT
jgi:hypothetical protein